MKKFRIIVTVIAAFLIITSVGVFAASKTQATNQTKIEDPTLTITKDYDGTTAAVVTPGLLTGAHASDDVNVKAVATYDTAAIGTAKIITVVYSLEGEDAGKYVKPVDYIATAGEITAAPLTIGDPILTLTKANDGSTTADAIIGSLTGIIIPENVSLSTVSTYDTADVGTGKTITVTYTLGGTDAGNYITPAAFTVATGEITDASAGAPVTSTSTSNETAPVAPAASAPDAVTSATVAP
ncbi:MAG: YDG domain-containing protein [Acetobacterium sp.]